MTRTGIDYFDECILKNGFPDGSLILVAGEPGAGKTIFSATFVYNGAKKFGEKGIYISLAETKKEFYESMKQLGMNFEELENKGLFKFVDLVTVREETIKKEIELLMNEIIKFQPKRIVVDPISVFAQVLGVEGTRVFLHTMLGRFIKTYNSTALLIAEKAIGAEKIGYGIEEFVVDGVIVLRYQSFGEVTRRVMEIPKMRRKSIEKSCYEYVITQDGIEFLAVPELMREEMEYTLEKVTTGIEKLDQMLDGGLYRGANVLIVGMTGTGKTTFSLHFAVANAIQGRRVAYLAFEEPMDQLIRATKNYGMPIEEALRSNLKIFTWVPESKTPVYTFLKIKKIIEEFKPEALVVDSLTALRQHMDEKELVKMIRYLNLLTKANRITAYFTLNEETNFEVVPFTGASTMVDVIIGLRYQLNKEGIERKMAIVKARGSDHSRKIHRYEITNKGVEIYE
ncbi:MAG: AAA family ATPase [Thermococcus sp.]|uniref:ATPase domain-containing protein n=1 Tax=Thermococcus sp. TaxID=35749 RepID=UPI000F27CF67|nr:ATPase domain-containing protein [Thermococcus sp.]MCD6140649.1 AAA family ATPase [Thermococcus sp.]MCD6144673.1 AAA family ATPase [Thermococcus sp.]RLF79253.1 MAG: circadian clock KaiC-like protein [Thermococci archaeon]